MRRYVLPFALLAALPGIALAQSAPVGNDSMAPGDPSTMSTANSSSDMSPGQSVTAAQTGNAGDDHATPPKAKSKTHKKKHASKPM